MYGSSKIRLATLVGEVPGTSGVTCKANVVHPGVLGSMAIAENRGVQEGAARLCRKSEPVLKSIVPIDSVEIPITSVG